MLSDNKKRILFVCPHPIYEAFSKSKISVAIARTPYLSLAALAAWLMKHNHSADILDLSISKAPAQTLIEKIRSWQPDYVGVTFTTPLYLEGKMIAKIVRENFPQIKLVAGGVHSTVLPEEVLKTTEFDYVVIGEGEETLLELIQDKNPADILGLAYKQGGQIRINKLRPLIPDINVLPYPAYYLYNIKNYQYSPRITARKSPVVAIETSRGCPFNCSYCNKKIFGHQFRSKTVERSVDEMEFLIRLGYKEIHVWDDCFSVDLNRAKAICDEIIRRKLKINWSVYNGIRVDRIDRELLEKLKASGCYRVNVGIEAGNQQILNNVDKGITIDQMRNVSKISKEVGIETTGFFMIGLPGETEETIKQTIELARELDFDLSKVNITIPLPGTRLFDQWAAEGRIKTFNWPDYNFHSTTIYDHPNLDTKTILKYYKLFYRRVYLRPKFLLRRLWRGLKSGDLFFDAYYFLKILLKFGW